MKDNYRSALDMIFIIHIFAAWMFFALHDIRITSFKDIAMTHNAIIIEYEERITDLEISSE